MALEDDGHELVPATLTPHGLRHTCASLLCAVGWNPRRIMGHLGHADAKFTVGVCTKMMAAATASPSGRRRSSRAGR